MTIFTIDNPSFLDLVCIVPYMSSRVEASTVVSEESHSLLMLYYITQWLVYFPLISFISLLKCSLQLATVSIEVALFAYHTA